MILKKKFNLFFIANTTPHVYADRSQYHPHIMPIYGTLVHNLNSPPQIYSSFFYYPPANDSNQSARAVTLCAEANAEISFRRDVAAGYGYYGVPPGTADDFGMLCLDALPLTGVPLRLVWRILPSVVGAPSVCVTLVLFENDSSAAALHFLSLVPSLMTLELRAQLAQRPEELLAFFQTFLPHGQLHVLTPALIKHMRKEYEQTLK